MMHTIRSEQIKLRTVLMHWVLGSIALAFPLVITLLNAFFRGDDDGFDGRSLLEVVTGTSVLAILLVAVIAAASVTGEFGFGTIRPTFAATPRRGRVVLAKAIVVVLLGVGLQLTVVLVGWFGGQVVANGRGSSVALGDVDAGFEALAGSIVFAALMALVGLGLGLLVRSTPAAVAALILWPLLVENLVGALLGLAFDDMTVTNWMPFRLGIQMLSSDGFDGPSRLTAGLCFAAFTLVVLGIGSWTLQRRDA